MILDTHIEIIGNPSNLNFYKKLGYNIENKKPITIPIDILSKTSHYLINVKCDLCGNIKQNVYKNYYKITNGLTSTYYCKKCKYKKVEKNNIEKYGHKSSLSTDETKEKIKITNLKLYGFEYYTQSSEYKTKIKNINLKKYNNECFLNTDIFKLKRKETLLSRYNTTNPMELDTIKEKMIFTNNKNILSKYKSLLNFNEYEILSYNKQYFNIKHIKCGNIFNIFINIAYDRKRRNSSICTICNPLNINISGKEKELSDWVKESNVSIIEGDRVILDGKELDIYIPSKNLAIEFNGLYWHSELKKERNYHLQKSLKCVDKRIQLLHIWEDEWIFKQDIVKSIILNKLGLITNKIYARQCEIRIVEDSKLVRKFLDENHIQGYSQSSIKLGLYKDNELVSLMTFGYRHTNSKKEFELIRFCNILNTNVIGASSKLFNYFKKNYPFTNLISYSDFRLFDGKMYSNLGFTKIHLSKPDYFWCKDLERKHRFNFNKKKLVREGFDGLKTEVEIMHERGYYRVFGCGQYRWEIKKEV